MIASDSELKVTLPSDREIELTRMFDAPRELVFKTMMDPDLIPRWWGPRRYTSAVDRFDFRVGGKWRFVNRDPQSGAEHWFHGEFREIVPPERVVWTFEYEPLPGHVSVDTVSFQAVGERTRIVVRSLFASKEDRDGMVSSGMESGAKETYERLAEILAEKTPTA